MRWSRSGEEGAHAGLPTELAEIPPIPLGAEIPSEVVPRVLYRVVREIGDGAMSIVYYALRVAPEGESPVVLKVLRPWLVRRAGPTAALIIKKEAVALGRLNERVPPTPFVVRFIDAGEYQARIGGQDLALPWVVLEHVHGGAEGTTLTDRVAHSLRVTGAAFDPDRAAHAVECLAAGLTAVHEMGVIHRDLKPDNVLCCGFGDEEIFKIADFGVARPAGVAGTFGGTILGTLGFAAPELAMLDQKAIGPWSDVFSLAAIIYYILTGEEYFPVDTPADAIVAACSPNRRSVRDARGLSPDLRASDAACRFIDFALAAATSDRIERRPQRADALAAMLIPWLREGPRSLSIAARRRDRLRDDEDDLTEVTRWSWTTCRPSFHDRGLRADEPRCASEAAPRIIRSAAWDGDGRCMAATSAGLAFWNGSTWADVDAGGFPGPASVRLVRRLGPGRWLVVGDDATFAICTPEGLSELRHLAGLSTRFELLSGDLDDLAVLVEKAPGHPPALRALSGRRWLKPLPLPDVAVVMSLTRIEDARWLLAGRGVDGRGFAAVYAPLDWEVTRLPAPSVRAFLACAGQPDRGVGLATGADGAIVWYREGMASMGEIAGDFDVSAASVDPVGRGWVAGAGRIGVHRAAAPEGRASLAPGSWAPLWQDESWRAPIVSLFTDLGIVIAMTADGGIIEGRALRAAMADR
ncbi:MAG: serine/threonine protein kinase [Polyangiaceae bacterium]|nr:serine/threonine protein kinase [Polyangiaceae bacterium]